MIALPKKKNSVLFAMYSNTRLQVHGSSMLLIGISIVFHARAMWLKMAVIAMHAWSDTYICIYCFVPSGKMGLVKTVY